MTPLSVPSSEPLSVRELTRRILLCLEADPCLRDVAVRGELSNFHRHSSGHLYFSLKDERASIRCVMFAGQARCLGFAPANGDALIARGHVSLFEAQGACQFYVQSLEKSGYGDLFQRFERLKRQLQAEGLTDPARRRPLPVMPRRVGIVTSAEGAALQDILRVSARRSPQIPILVSPCRVQGHGAAEELAAALRRLQKVPDLDVIIIGRGGGSFEDLFAFSEECLVRAVAASVLPVVSAVGHETDFSLCDMVADLRAPTPSAAAELVFPDRREWQIRLTRLREAMQRSVTMRAGRLTDRLQRLESWFAGDRYLRRLETLDADLGRLQRDLGRGLRQSLRAGDLRLALFPPGRLGRALEEILRQRDEGLPGRKARLDQAIGRRLDGAAERLESGGRSLKLLNPRAILARGYAVVRRAGETAPVINPRTLDRGTVLDIELAGGRLAARVMAHGKDGQDDGSSS